MLILYGSASPARFEQIRATCSDNHVAFLTYRFEVDGQPESEHSVRRYLNKGDSVRLAAHG